MKINLKSDAKAIYQHIKQRVKDYPVYVNMGPGEDEDPVTHITLGYQVSQAGWVALVFDTRPDGQPDGVWQSYIAENSLEFPQWFEALEALWDNGEPIELTLPTGKKESLGEDDDLAEWIGIMLKDVLLRARKDKCFKNLPLASRVAWVSKTMTALTGGPTITNACRMVASSDAASTYRGRSECRS